MSPSPFTSFVPLEPSDPWTLVCLLRRELDIADYFGFKKSFSLKRYHFKPLGQVAGHAGMTVHFIQEIELLFHGG